MNYYQLLDLDYHADEQEIKSSYRRLAMKYHPDRVTGQEEKFKLINEAYKVLSDTEKRKEYNIRNNIGFVIKNQNNQINQHILTAPYDSSLNIFNDALKEIFFIIREESVRSLKHALSIMKNVNLENHFYQKYTPLMEAVYIQRLDMVQFITQEIKNKYTRNGIIQNKYSRYLNQITVEGKTALIIASLTNTNPEIMKFLIKEGAEINIKDKENKTILDYATLSQTQEMEDFILSLK